MTGIERIRIEKFGCIEDVDLELGPLQAFIGPNDSGKSTILRAVALAVRTVNGDRLPDLQMRAGGQIDIQTQGGSGSLVFERPGVVQCEVSEATKMALLRDSAFVRLNPDALREPSELIPDGDLLGFFAEASTRLAGLFDALMTRNDRAIEDITRRVCERFPTVKHIGLRNASTTQKELQFELIDGTKVPASMASEGLLYYLAFATLPYLHTHAGILLVEAPENGLHPARIRDVVDTLREISKTTQVLIATHSPILVNELRPEEIFATTRDPKLGTRVTRLDRTPNFAERSRVYNPGELWVAYADGDTEAALLGEDACLGQPSEPSA